MHKTRALGSTIYFWFAANDTSGSGADGASPLCDVRLAGAAVDAAPVAEPTAPPTPVYSAASSRLLPSAVPRTLRLAPCRPIARSDVIGAGTVTGCWTPPPDAGLMLVAVLDAVGVARQGASTGPGATDSARTGCSMLPEGVPVFIVRDAIGARIGPSASKGFSR